MSNNTFGIYYETPDGRIAYAYGVRDGYIRYMFDDDNDEPPVSLEEFDTWKPRQDLKDFPNARDPRVSYVYDLLWDIKHKSQLDWALQHHPDRDEIKLLVEEHGTEPD